MKNINKKLILMVSIVAMGMMNSSLFASAKRAGVAKGVLSTVFNNDAGTSISVQPLVSGVASGDAVVIDYTNTTPFASASVPAKGAPANVSYSVTVPGQSWPAVVVPYSSAKKSFQVNADAVKGLIYVG